VTLHVVHWGYKQLQNGNGTVTRTLPMLALPSIAAAHASGNELLCQHWPPTTPAAAACAGFEDWQALHQAHEATSFLVKAVLSDTVCGWWLDSSWRLPAGPYVRSSFIRMRHLQVLPLAVNGRKLGALLLSAGRGGRLSPEVLDLVREYSAHLAQLLSAWAAREEQLAGEKWGGGGRLWCGQYV
jgi:hypothetical protein